MKELPGPPAGDNPADAGPEPVEVLRAWIQDGALDCNFDPDAFDDPAVWGELLAVIVQQVAQARLIDRGTPTAETLKVIRQAFDDEFTGDTPG